MSAGHLRVCAIAGSLRRGSYNRALVEAARELAPSEMSIRVFEGLARVPLFNQDLEAEGDPAPVSALKEAIRDADALLLATPEYNHGIPGVLKNALDWASRPRSTSALRGRPVAMLGASTGLVGTARAQGQLLQVLAYTSCLVMPQPQILVSSAAKKFDAEGQLTDQSTRDHLARFLESFLEWARRGSSP